MSKEIIVICSGGSLDHWALPIINQADYKIGVDRGALFLINHQLSPDLSLGDFDSISQEQMQLVQQRSNKVLDYDAINKDYTDTQLAVIEAIKRKPSEIHIVGGLGTRFDHSLATVQLLELGVEQQIPITIHDQHNKIVLVNHMKHVQRDHYRYISLIPLTDIVTGITLEGFKYPLTDATLHRGFTIGISNELTNDSGFITVASGQLLIIQSND